MKHIAIGLIMLLAAITTMAQNVSNVQFERKGKELVITYDLDAKSDVRVSLSIDSGATYSGYIEGLSGDVGAGVKPGTGKRILAYDLPQLRFVPEEMNDQIVFRVEVDDGTFTVTVGNVNIKLIPVEGGTFTMGCTKPAAGSYYYKEELPTHEVTLSSFYIAQYEVTQQLWQAVMDTNPAHFSGENMPVESISWNDAQLFIMRLSQMTGYRFRLPTEAEWEYAARGGQKSKGNIYAGAADVALCGWYCVNSNNHTHPVGQLQPNELGLYDMSGNVWEWCSDWLGTYSAEPQTNPLGPKDGLNRVVRGGSISSPSYGCRVSDRSGQLPEYGYEFYGMRLVLDSIKKDE